jgi:hypothetical protein
MKTLFEDAWEKVEEGLTTVDEIIAKIPYHQILTAEKEAAGKKAKKKVLTPETSKA